MRSLVVGLAAIGCWMAFGDSPQTSTASQLSKIYIRPGNGWTPVSGSARIKPGSAIDFSQFVGRRDPAGANGWLVAKGSHFEFSHRPGVVQRFYGVNLCGDANFFDDAQIDELLTRLERVGYNAIRIHHHDGPLVEGSADGTTPNPKRMAQLDALVAKAAERGFYVTTDLYVSRSVPARVCGVDRDGVLKGSEYKEMALCHEGVKSNLFAFTRHLLNHVNPRTGRRWAVEPALAWLSLINEGNPGNRGLDFSRKIFGITKEAMDDEAFKHYLAEKQKTFDRELIDFLRKELGFKGLISSINGWTNYKPYQEARQAYDYVDDHFYMGHPESFNGATKIGSNTNPLVSPDGILGYSGPKGHYHWTWWRGVRLPDRPLTVSEWNFASPSRYRGMAGLLFGTGAAVCDFGAAWRFDWSNNGRRALIDDDRMLAFFDVAVDPVMRASERAVMALYLRNDLGKEGTWDFDKKNGAITVASPRTCGVFAEASEQRHRAGVLEVSIRDHFATVWATSLDGAALRTSKRILLTHLTDAQDDGNCFSEDMKTLYHWGRLPHLMANGKAKVALHHDTPQELEVWALADDGARRARIEAKVVDGCLFFVVDVARDPKEATYQYEIVSPKREVFPELLTEIKSTYDGTLQPCYFYAPEKAKTEPVPLVVGLHTWSGDWRFADHYLISYWYAKKHGWAMVGPNFRGPNKTPSACGGEAAVQDIVDAVDYAKAQVKIDPKRVYIIGGSGGGHMTLLMAGRHPEIWAGCAAFCPITDVARWHADSLLKHPGRGPYYATMLEGACGGTPAEKPDEYSRRSPLTWLANAKVANVPVYIVTGIHDGWTGSVPIGHALRAFNALAVNENDRVSESDIAFIEENQRIPDGLVGESKEDPFYGEKIRIHFRRTSGNVRMTLFEGGHAGNFEAGLDFLSRQVKGQPADFALPATATGSEEKLGQ